VLLMLIYRVTYAHRWFQNSAEKEKAKLLGLQDHGEMKEQSKQKLNQLLVR